MSQPAHLSTVARQAHTLHAQGSTGAAQAMLEQALDSAALTLGPDHPDVLAATRLLAAMYSDTGQYAEARRRLEEGIAAAHFSLGDQHPVLLTLSYDLALIANELGNRHEARRNFALVARYGPAALGADHEYVHTARRYLAGADEPGPSTPPPPAPPSGPPAPAPPPASPGPPDSAVTGPPGWGYTVEAAGVARCIPTAPARQPVPAPPPAVSLPVPRRPLSDGREIGAEDERRSRLPLLVLIVVALLALAAGTVATVVLVNRDGRTRGAPRAERPGATTSATPAPEIAPSDAPQVRLRDDGTAITLTWTDPHGATLFLITGGRRGAGYQTLAQLPGGTTTYTLNGVDPKAEYCFIVAGLYDANQVVPADPACTRRPAPSGS